MGPKVSAVNTEQCLNSRICACPTPKTVSKKFLTLSQDLVLYSLYYFPSCNLLDRYTRQEYNYRVQTLALVQDMWPWGVNIGSWFPYFRLKSKPHWPKCMTLYVAKPTGYYHTTKCRNCPSYPVANINIMSQIVQILI